MGLRGSIDYENGQWLAGSQEEIEEQFADTRPHINRQNRLGHIVVAVEIVDHRRPETVVTEENIATAEYQNGLAEEFGEQVQSFSSLKPPLPRQWGINFMIFHSVQPATSVPGEWLEYGLDKMRYLYGLFWLSVQARVSVHRRACQNSLHLVKFLTP